MHLVALVHNLSQSVSIDHTAKLTLLIHQNINANSQFISHKIFTTVTGGPMMTFGEPLIHVAVSSNRLVHHA